MSTKFSIITPSFNQASFLPQTLSSVRNQSFTDYEHLIFDPGSTDGSVDILKEYCQSEPRAKLQLGRDKSQTNAINIGFSEASGDILCWLNSDDRYASPDVLKTVARCFRERPEVQIVYGRGRYVSTNGEALKDAFVHQSDRQLPKLFANSLGILQPALFMRRSVFTTLGEFDERMHFSFDYEYWARCAKFSIRFHFVNVVLAEAVIHEGAKTMRARKDSLAESVMVAERYYNFVSRDWIDRVVDNEHSGADGIITNSKTMPENLIKARFIQKNRGARALEAFLNRDPAMNESTRKAFSNWIIPEINRAYISAWDANYFDMGLTLLASIHRHDPEAITFVCDIGMKEDQRAFIRTLSGVVFLEKDFPDYSFDWQKDAKNYVFKNILYCTIAEELASGTSLLWVDAGVSLCRKPSDIFAQIKRDGYLFIDHDDSCQWPLFNASFTSDEAIYAAEFSWSEMVGPHVITCLYGFLIQGPYHHLIREAAQLAAVYSIGVGDKHPPESIKKKALDKKGQQVYAERLKLSSNPVDNLQELRRIFGYYGHRQDQSILSALVARHGLKISSAKKYCPANSKSSEISKEHWFDGVSSRVGKFCQDDFNPGGATFHHRGLVKDFTGLLFDIDRRRICAVLGNGPSLAEFDFQNNQEIDSIGMNAAYRYWHKVKWYPKIYSCLDSVVGISHKEAILDLVRHQRRYGISQFLLRENLFDWLADREATENVICFDLVREGFEVLHPEPITTGSHSLAWATLCGYERVLISGVDCNYTEKAPGVQSTDKRTLVVAEERNNSNYFFNGYQKVGDEFNVPNPSQGLHIRSWRNIAEKLPSFTMVVNVSSVSEMDAFPRVSIAKAFELLRPDFHSCQPSRAQSPAASYRNIQQTGRVWRENWGVDPINSFGEQNAEKNNKFELITMLSGILLGRYTAADKALKIKIALRYLPEDSALRRHALKVLKCKE